MTGIKESKEKGFIEVLKFRKSRCWLWVYVEKNVRDSKEHGLHLKQIQGFVFGTFR